MACVGQLVEQIDLPRQVEVLLPHLIFSGLTAGGFLWGTLLS